jgi:hypothetical protein
MTEGTLRDECRNLIEIRHKKEGFEKVDSEDLKYKLKYERTMGENKRSSPRKRRNIRDREPK